MATVKFMVQPFNLRRGRFHPISRHLWQPLATCTNRMFVGESGIFGAAWYESACGAYFLRPSQACTQYENMDTRNCFATLWWQMSCNTWQLPISADQQNKKWPKEENYSKTAMVTAHAWATILALAIPGLFLHACCLLINTCPAFNCSELHNARMAIPPSVRAWGPPTKPTKPT